MMQKQQWEYEAPMYGSLAHQSPPQDHYFSHKTTQQMTYYSYEERIIKTEAVTPTSEYSSDNSETTQYGVKKEPETRYPAGFRRRSMSVHAVLETNKHASEMDKIVKDIENIKLSRNGKLGKNTFSHCNFGKKSQSVTSLASNTNIKKFVSTAEAIYHMQKDTPERFHSHSRNAINNIHQKKIMLQSTIPYSPALISKTRSRPVTALSLKQLEDIEIEEIKKHKIKAHPVSDAVLRGIPLSVPVQQKQATRPIPFNLTETKKKPLITDEKPKGFVARPMPKHIFEKQIEIKQRRLYRTTSADSQMKKMQKSRSLDYVCVTSNGLLSKAKSKMAPINLPEKPDLGQIGHSGVPLSQKNVISTCKVQPFSFDQKDKERWLKKQEKILKSFEEEKKLREFHANPIPTAILKKTKTTSSHSPSSNKENNVSKEDMENMRGNNTRQLFKARPAAVLFKAPFVPTFNDKILTEPCHVQLTTEQRARDRQAFEIHLKEKEEQFEKMRKTLQEAERLKEEEEIRALRNQLVHKAGPIKQYPPLIIQPSKVPLTASKSPNFVHK